MRFDPLSFVLGFISSAGLSLALWRFRGRLGRLRTNAGQRIEGTRRFIGQAADARYRQDLLDYVQQAHIAGALFPLTDILLETRLLLPPATPTPPEADRPTREHIFDVVPIMHDMPHSYAPFNLDSITLADLGHGSRSVALLGLPGMGKSTALASLALMALDALRFETLESMTRQAISEQEEDLSDLEREQRASERQQAEERVMQKLREAREAQNAHILVQDDDDQLSPLDIGTLLPVLVHLADVMLDPAAYGSDDALDPAEPLVRAAQQYTRTVTSQVVGSAIYPALERGTALVLIDGYDELSPDRRAQYEDWLSALRRTYPDSLMVVAGPVTGYESLEHIGFTPTFLRARMPDDYAALVERWVATWRSRARSRRSTSDDLDEAALRRIKTDNRGRTALDVTLKIWAGLAEDTRTTGRSGWYDALIQRRLPDESLQPALNALAAAALDAGGPLTGDDAQAVLRTALAPAEDGKNAPDPDDTLAALTKAGLLVPHADGSYRLPHLQVAAYLASETLRNAPLDRLAAVAAESAWQDALSFAAAHTNLEPALVQKLRSPLDLMISQLFGLAHWLPDAPPDARWRNDLLQRLATAFMAQSQYLTVRERAMAALVAARDRGVTFFFRRALLSTNPDARRLACIGLGAVGDPETVKDLAPMLNDSDANVHIAAALALGAIGTELAMEEMVHALLNGSEDQRRAVTEALAALPGEGHAILRDGVKSDDLMVRRASVFGLRRVREPWALVELYNTMLQDNEWYVQSAAEDGFMQAQTHSVQGPRPRPEADSLVWLIQWAADIGEGVPAGPNAREVLVRALREGGNPQHRILAAQTLGQLGHIPALKALYHALRDRDPDVRSAAYAALTDIQMRSGTALPGLI